jgi:signal peptidase II
MRWMAKTAALTLALDQISKIGVVQLLDLKTRGQIDVIPPLLTFRMAWNRGMNFGLFASNADLARWLLIGVALAISTWVVWWVRRDGLGLLAQIGAGLLVGGALGNVLDRLIYGAVADFLNMSVPGLSNPWSFNIADAAIFLGAVTLVLSSGAEKSGDKTP